MIGAIFVYMDGEKMINDPVHVPDIESLSFQCKLNGLVMDGEITFIDRNGIFDKYMTHQNSVFVVSISQGQPSGSGARRSIKTLCEFKHTFIIESVQILNKSKSEMKYKVALVSETWFNVTKPVSFSTHDAPPDQKRVTDILKTTFT